MKIKINTKEEALGLLVMYLENTKACDTRFCDIGDCSRCWREQQNSSIEEFIEGLDPSEFRIPEFE